MSEPRKYANVLIGESGKEMTGSGYTIGVWWRNEPRDPESDRKR
jgi:hypothetical protein